MKSRNKAPVIIITFFGIIILGMIGFIIYKSFFTSSQNVSIQQSSATDTAQPKDSVPTKDFAPNLPSNQKTTITIRTSDSSEIKYLVPSTQVQTYVSNLPQGYTVVSMSK